MKSYGAQKNYGVTTLLNVQPEMTWDAEAGCVELLASYIQDLHQSNVNHNYAVHLTREDLIGAL